MTVVSSIINDAFREGNILPLAKAPTDAQATEALRLLNQLFSSIYGDAAGEALQDWPLGNFGRESPEYNLGWSEYQVDRPTINQRLLALNEEARTVYLSLYPQDGSRMGIVDPYGRLESFPVTLDGNGRTIEGAATLVLNTNGLYREWFYRADLGNWMRLTGIGLTDEMPFPAEHDLFFVLLLAMRINPRFGRSMDQQSERVYMSERRKFVARYLQSMPLEILDDISWPFLSLQSYDQQREFSSNRAFNRGGYFWRP
ncbi:MAG: hypothetical protein C0510_12990 [Erythrobacter sp.]|nr:hypothetical protein [Erythrobacter sp.]